VTGQHLISAVAVLLCTAPCVCAADFTVGNGASFLGNKRWRWTVFITASPAVLSRIRCVEYQLHPTYADSIQVICERGPDPQRAFPLSSSGWGEFNIRVKATFTDRQPQTVNYWLKLKAQQSPLCRVLTRRTLAEDELMTFPQPYRDIHVYVEELHRRSPAELIIVASARKPDKDFDWDKFKRPLREINQTKQPLTTDTYVKVSAGPHALQTIGIRGAPTLRFFVGETEKGTTELSMCEPPVASQATAK
jgi:hypothetical protein